MITSLASIQSFVGSESYSCYDMIVITFVDTLVMYLFTASIFPYSQLIVNTCPLKLQYISSLPPIFVSTPAVSGGFSLQRPFYNSLQRAKIIQTSNRTT